ncbi:MAG: polyprenyl synthetase family protein [Candidatus Puniceispirillaceae bacterium]
MESTHATNSPPVAEAAPSLDGMVRLCEAAMADVNSVILEKMASEVPLIPDLAGHLIAAGGKRMRPMLTLMGTLSGLNETNGPEPLENKMPIAALHLAAAVEFIHNATLLHDDVIDQSEKRRGRDTANAMWGNEASVLVGDFLFARAFELMVSTGDIEILRMLSSASARITEGEVMQMSMVGMPDSKLEDYFSVITNKTAILFAAAAESGARVGNASDAICRAMHEYGLALGRAFQICDDALDYGTDSDMMGKKCGDDFYDGKITMPVILAWQDGNATERDFWMRTLSQQEYREGDLQIARSYLADHQAVERALAYAKTEAEAAIAALAPLGTTQISAAMNSAARFAAKRAY